MQRFLALNSQNIVRDQRTIRQSFSGDCFISGVNIQVPVSRNVVFFLHSAFTANYNRHFTLVLIALQLYPAANLSHHGWVLGFTCFKYFGNSGQATCDVLGTAGSSGLMSKQLAGLHALALNNLDSGSCRQIVDIKYFAAGIFYDNLWVLIALMFDYHGLANLAFPLFFNPNCLAFHDIGKSNYTRHFRQYRRTVRVPFEQHSPDFHFLTVLNYNSGTIRHFKLVKFSLLCVKDSYFAIAFEYNHLFSTIVSFKRDRIYIAILNLACNCGFLFSFKNSSGSEAAGMERA